MKVDSYSRDFFLSSLSGPKSTSQGTAFVSEKIRRVPKTPHADAANSNSPGIFAGACLSSQSTSRFQWQFSSSGQWGRQ